MLADGPSLIRWWPAVYLSVDSLKEGEESGLGAEVTMFTKGWLPYTLRWTLRVTEPITDTGYALIATGDLIGTGRWTFTQDGPEVVITYDWRVSASKPLLRRLTWLLRPVFAANHRWAMARGEESLRLELRRRRATSEAERSPDTTAATGHLRLVDRPPTRLLNAGVRVGVDARSVEDDTLVEVATLRQCERALEGRVILEDVRFSMIRRGTLPLAGRGPGTLWVPRTRSRYATCRYSCMRPPSRSRRSGRMVAAECRSARPAGGC